MAIYQEFKERGFIQQQSDPKEIENLLDNGKATFYIGFDATADSLHVGHLLTIMAMAHLQKAGHKPIAVIGGGTTMIGDPSGKTEMRKILSKQEIYNNGKKIRLQLDKFLDFNDNRALFVNNADWLIDLNYIEFLRDIGKYFRVNEMIKMEAYRLRLEREEGLSFLEFNYQLLQAYDYLQLFDKHNCTLQMGGDDQWGNILAGVDLIRKAKGENVFALTFPLLTTANGAKMGKTESGAMWLDPEKNKSYEYFQYWMKCDDRDVEKFLKLFTFLTLDEIRNLVAGDIRQAKERLAYEVTKITHGEEEALRARQASERLFSRSPSPSPSPSPAPPEDFEDLDIPTTEISELELNGLNIVDLLIRSGLCKSKSEAKKLISSNGVYVWEETIDSDITDAKDFVKDNMIMLRKGKKTYHKIKIN